MLCGVVRSGEVRLGGAWQGEGYSGTIKCHYNKFKRGVKMRCPICRGKFSHDDCVRENLKDEYIEIAAYFGRGWLAVNEYVDCFRGSQYGSVGEKKRLRILQEIKSLFESCEFDFEKKRYRTDKKSIYGAIKVIIDKEMTKLKDHNYLKQILIDPFEGTLNVVKAKRVSAEGMTAHEETEREKLKALGSKVKGEEITGAEFMKRNNLGSLIDGIGKKLE